MADPVAIFPSRTRPDSLLVLTEFTEPGQPHRRSHSLGQDLKPRSSRQSDPVSLRQICQGNRPDVRREPDLREQNKEPFDGTTIWAPIAQT
ncbi:hypothetical protein, partial [Verrucomicrobium spinosum]|uniref:hypothetical protein n=1 Tax=Verrucomicrobium spinosum TaxID=2736 RepID=UPI003CCE4C29